MDKNILLSESKCLKIFIKYNFDYDKDIFENKQKLFERLCEIPNINYKIIKNCIDNNPDIDFIHHFFKSLNNDIYKSIRLLKYYIDINNIDKNIILLNEINKKLELYDTSNRLIPYIFKKYKNNNTTQNTISDNSENGDGWGG